MKNDRFTWKVCPVQARRVAALAAKKAAIIDAKEAARQARLDAANNYNRNLTN